jgi:hypothetical protein
MNIRYDDFSLIGVIKERTLMPDLCYKVGDKGACGETISFIVGHSPDIIVYRDSNGHIQWETKDDVLTSSQARANNEYDKLNFKILSFISAKRKESFEMQLAQALFRGLSESTEQEVLKHFEASLKSISQEIYSNSAFYYVLFAGILTALYSGAIAILITFFLAGSHRIIVLGSLAGAVGAFASILFRGNKLKLREYESPRTLGFQGTTRIFLGIIFGGFSIYAINANMVLGILSSDHCSVIAMAFISGFSERFVPELVKSLEKQ